MQYFNYNNTFEENKKIYRALVKKHHPDKNGDNNTFLIIQNQWELYANTYTKADTTEKKQAFNEFASTVDFSRTIDPVKFYEDNKLILNTLINNVILKNKKPMHEDEIAQGFKIAKYIFNLFK